MTRANRKFLLKFFVATSLLALLPFGVARWQENRRRNAPKAPYTFPFAELAALDKVVQERFAVIPDSDFGVGRIGKRHDVFVPQTAKEKAVVAALKKRGLEVVFYVAGRNYLLGRQVLYAGPQFLQGPVFITGKPLFKTKQTPYSYFSPIWNVDAQLPPDLPDGGNVLNSPLYVPARKALDSFKANEGANFSIAKWKVAARPVVASQQACVDCHNSRISGGKWERYKNSFQLGDTLGVAMYAYRMKKELK